MNTLKLTACAIALTTIFAALPGTAAPKKTHTAPKKAATRVANEIVTIINSGDRLSPGYTVTLTSAGALRGVVRNSRGKATVSRSGHMIEPTRDRLFEALHQAEPLNRLQTESRYSRATPQVLRQQGRRGRRGGFNSRPEANQSYAAPVTGPEVYIIYRGVRSPNLRAASDSKGKELYQHVKQAVEVLRLPIPNVP